MTELANCKLCGSEPFRAIDVKCNSPKCSLCDTRFSEDEWQALMGERVEEVESEYRAFLEFMDHKYGVIRRELAEQNLPSTDLLGQQCFFDWLRQCAREFEANRIVQPTVTSPSVDNSFRCPECGGAMFGTSNSRDWADAAGHCHSYKEDGSRCRFTWHRATEDHLCFVQPTGESK